MGQHTAFILLISAFYARISSMTRIVYMGTPDFSVPALESLIESGMLVGVVTQPDRPAGRGNRLRPPPVKVAAEKAGIPVFQPKSLRKEEAAAPIREWQPDLIIVAAFGQILKPHILDYPRLGCVNIHASLLPRWRGAAPIQAAILHGDTDTGITLMQMDVGLDTGDILVSESIPLAVDETASTLHDKLAAMGGMMVEKYLPALIEQRLPSTPQDDAFATYASRISKEDGEIDWEKSAVEIDRHIRAMSPWPGAHTVWNGKQLKIHAAQPATIPFYALGGYLPGTVFIPDGSDVMVQTGSGGIRLETIQLSGKKALDVADFVRGRPEFIGATLGKG